MISTTEIYRGNARFFPYHFAEGYGDCFHVHLMSIVFIYTCTQVWLSILVFVIGFLTNGSIVIIGLIAMEVAPKKLVGSAHGLACAVAQGRLHYCEYSKYPQTKLQVET